MKFRFLSLSAAALLAIACSGSRDTGTSQPGTRDSGATGGATSSGGSSSSSGGASGSSGSVGSGGVTGTECKTNGDCPQTNCFGCPGIVCVNGRCVSASAGSGGANGAGGRTAATGGTSSGAYLPCNNPMPRLVGGVDTGFVSCDGKVLHRRAVVDCPSVLPRANGGACTSGPNAIASEPCAADADCTKRPNGFCTTVPTSHYPGCGCVYGCLRDGDCEAGEICECGDPVGRCVKATCTEDSACPSGSLCASAPLSWGGCSFYPPAIGFQCQTTRDVCLTDQSCSAGSPACALDTDAGVRGCHQGQLACP